MIVLGIETSCDETSLSIINEDNHLMSNVIVSQHSTHSPHGGIIPELASRQHIINIEDAFEKCLKDARVNLNDISVIGVTNGNVLIGDAKEISSHNCLISSNSRLTVGLGIDDLIIVT